MRMNRMRPVFAVISQDPDLARPLLDFRVDSLTVAECLTIDSPKSPQIVEDPDPMLELAEILRHWRQVAEVIRNLARVGARRLDHVEAHNAVTGIQYPPGRTSSVYLLESILKNDLIAWPVS